MTGIKIWANMTVLGFEENFMLCSKWDKWFKCLNRCSIITWYLFLLFFYHYGDTCFVEKLLRSYLKRILQGVYLK